MDSMKDSMDSLLGRWLPTRRTPKQIYADSMDSLLGRWLPTRRTPKQIYADRPTTTPQQRAKRRKRSKQAKLSRRANRG